MIKVNDRRVNVVNWYDGAAWRLGKFIRRFPLYDRVNSATLVRWFCRDAAAHCADMPQEIDIETINRCNGDCGFCPANFRDDKRVAARMPDQLIRKIAAELRAENYSGTIVPFVNNEPLLDSRITETVALLRESCPKARIVLCTNGILLTAKLYFSLFDAGLSHLMINNYSDRGEFTEKIGAALEGILSFGHVSSQEYLKSTVILLRNKNEILNSRAGEAPNKLNAERYRYYQRNSCIYPFRQMSILSDGRVALCCEDFTGRVALGNVGAESIRSIWNGPGFCAVREGLRSRGRTDLQPCRRCDYGHLGVAKAKTLLRHFTDWFS